MNVWQYQSERIIPVVGTEIPGVFAETARKFGFVESSTGQNKGMVRNVPAGGKRDTATLRLFLLREGEAMQLKLERHRGPAEAPDAVPGREEAAALLWRAESEIWLERIWNAMSLALMKGGIGLISAEVDAFYKGTPEVVAKAVSDYYRGHFLNDFTHVEFINTIPNTDGEQGFHGQAACTRATQELSRARLRVVAYMRADGLTPDTLAVYNGRFRTAIQRDLALIAYKINPYPERDIIARNAGATPEPVLPF